MASTGNLDASPILRWIEAHLDYPHKDYCLIWPFGLRAGYGFFTLDEKTVCAHRYICERKHGPAPFGHVASHSCDRGHEACVNHHHLSWQTNSSNQLRRKDHKGGRRFKLGWDEVETILKLKGIETPVDTAKRFGVSESAIRQVQSGKTWKASRRGTSFTDAQIQDIRANQGIRTGIQVATEYNIKPCVVYRIWHRQSWAHVPELDSAVTTGYQKD